MEASFLISSWLVKLPRQACLRILAPFISGRNLLGSGACYASSTFSSSGSSPNLYCYSHSLSPAEYQRQILTSWSLFSQFSYQQSNAYWISMHPISFSSARVTRPNMAQVAETDIFRLEWLSFLSSGTLPPDARTGCRHSVDFCAGRRWVCSLWCAASWGAKARLMSQAALRCKQRLFGKGCDTL